jgi:hypothetical protein
MLCWNLVREICHNLSRYLFCISLFVMQELHPRQYMVSGVTIADTAWKSMWL